MPMLCFIAQEVAGRVEGQTNVITVEKNVRIFLTDNISISAKL